MFVRVIAAINIDEFKECFIGFVKHLQNTQNAKGEGSGRVV
jgi:hypothetical protein